MNKITLLAFIFLMTSCSNDIKIKNNDLYKENLNGNVKSISQISYEAKHKFGEIIKGRRLHEDFTSPNFIKTFNETGQIIVNEFQNSIGNFISKEIHFYDNTGNKIEISYYGSKGILYFSKSFKYNDMGNIIETDGYNSEGELRYKNKYLYDEHDREIEIKSYNYDGSLGYKEIHIYDYLNRTKESNNFNSDGVFNVREIYEYDEYWNEIEISDSEGMNISYTYEYDKSDNWIERIEFKYGKPQYILAREIEYYD